MPDDDKFDRRIREGSQDRPLHDPRSRELTDDESSDLELPRPRSELPRPRSEPPQPRSDRPAVSDRVPSPEVGALRAAWIHDYVLYVWALDRAGTPAELRDSLAHARSPEAWITESVSVELRQPDHRPQIFAIRGSLPPLARAADVHDHERFNEQAEALSDSLDQIHKAMRAMAASVSTGQDQAWEEDEAVSWQTARGRVSALDPPGVELHLIANGLRVPLPANVHGDTDLHSRPDGARPGATAPALWVQRLLVGAAYASAAIVTVLLARSFTQVGVAIGSILTIAAVVAYSLADPKRRAQKGPAASKSQAQEAKEDRAEGMVGEESPDAGRRLDAQRQESPSPREVEWLRQLATGSTVAQLAEKAGYSQQAMHHQLRSLYRRIGVRTRAEALLHARQRGWL